MNTDHPPEHPEDKPLYEVQAGYCRSPAHSVMVRPYLMGQFRIQLTRVDWPDEFAPPGHGSIVRELCTYRRDIAIETTWALAVASDPEAYCRTLEQPWNCELPGRGRIRLDNEEGDREASTP